MNFFQGGDTFFENIFDEIEIENFLIFFLAGDFFCEGGQIFKKF